MDCGNKFPESLYNFDFAYICFQCMSMLKDLTKEMQALRDEHKQQTDQIKGVSTNVATDNKLEIYNNYLMDNVKGVNYGSQIIIFLVI
jgi:hypothetical protein